MNPMLQNLMVYSKTPLIPAQAGIQKNPEGLILLMNSNILLATDWIPNQIGMSGSFYN